MKYRIEKKSVLRLVGAHTPLVTDDERNRGICSSFWRSCADNGTLETLVNLKSVRAKQIRGISYYADADNIRYYIALETALEAPAGIEVLELPASEWAIFACDGRFPQTVQDAYKKFYPELLPFSGYQAAQTADMEIYPVSDTLLESGKYELWIAIEPLED